MGLCSDGNIHAGVDDFVNAAVFAGATNTLFAPVLIGLEVFGSNDMIPFFIVCMIAYLVNGNKSIYGAQEVNG